MCWSSGSRTRSRSGPRSCSWDPPERFRLNWHPGSDLEHATDLEVTFTPDGEDTLVTLVHSGWERTAAPEEMARNYDTGWAYVLGWYDAMVGRIAAAIGRRGGRVVCPVPLGRTRTGRG